MDQSLSWSDFEKVKMCVGTILNAQQFPEARKPAFKLEIDFGNELGILRSSAQITTHYTTEELIGRQIVAVVNFPKKQIGNFLSECLVLGALGGEAVVLLSPDQPVQNGSRIA